METQQQYENQQASNGKCPVLSPASARLLHLARPSELAPYPSEAATAVLVNLCVLWTSARRGFDSWPGDQ
jgi:hypothetical protein